MMKTNEELEMEIQNLKILNSTLSVTVSQLQAHVKMLESRLNAQINRSQTHTNSLETLFRPR